MQKKHYWQIFESMKRIPFEKSSLALGKCFSWFTWVVPRAHTSTTKYNICDQLGRYLHCCLSVWAGLAGMQAPVSSFGSKLNDQVYHLYCPTDLRVAARRTSIGWLIYYGQRKALLYFKHNFSRDRGSARRPRPGRGTPTRLNNIIGLPAAGAGPDQCTAATEIIHLGVRTDFHHQQVPGRSSWGLETRLGREMNKFYHQQGDGGCWLEINSYLMTLSFCYSTESFGITVLTQSNSEFDFMPIYKCFQLFGSAQYIFLNWPPMTSHKFDDSFTKIEACLLVVMQ